MRIEPSEGATGCPDDETLAVYLEGGLAGHDRTRLEAHMAGCPRCLDLLSVLAPHLPDVAEGEVVPIDGATFPTPGQPVAALAPASRPVVTPPPTRPRWLVPIAAAVALVLGGAAFVWQASGPDVGLETLQAVHVAQRPVVGQLAGFPYAPAPTIMRSGRATASATTDLLTAAAAVYDAHQGREAAESLHAAGVAELVSGGTPEAIATLRRALAAAPDDVRIVNDTATALLQQAQMTSDVAALAEARVLARRATQLDPSFTPGWFNLATAARLADDASEEQQALSRLSALDPQSPWHAELTRRR